MEAKEVVRKTTFFTIRNLTETDVVTMDKPWEFDSSKCPWGGSKAKYKKWMAFSSTDHCLYSMVAGRVPTMKVGTDNEAEFIHGFAADYDGMAPGDPMNVVEKRAGTEFLPNFVTTTFSDKIRLVWMFEKPMRVMDTDHAKAMLIFIGKKLNANKWFADLDKNTYDPGSVFCIGKKWEPTSQVNRYIREFTIDAWLQEYFIANQKKLVSRTSTLIPYEEIEAEAKRRGFQNVPRFEAGQHCRRFWAPESDNDNGCLLTDYGVYVYVPHDKPFMRWRDIFGPEFTAQYENREFADFYDTHYFDNQKREYWYRRENGDFVKRNKEAITTHLRCLGSSPFIPKGETCSDIDRRMLYIELSRGVDVVRELVYFPTGVVRDHDNMNVLNKSRIRTIEPSAPMVWDAKLPWNSKEVASAFPFIHGLLNHMFNVAVPGQAEGAPTQIDYLLWFLARFYRGGYYRQPTSGHALFLAGGVGQGKSLLCSFIIPQLMGGTNCNAESFLMGKTHFSSGFTKQPVITLSDCSSANHKAPALIRDLLKKVVADGTIDFHEKNGAEDLISWFGRFLVTLNTDYESTRILPTLDKSVCDKFLYLLALDGNKTYDKFGTRQQNEARIKAELPAFARYLLDLPIPDENHPYYDVRFGFKAWQHPFLCDRCSLDETSDCILEAFDLAWGSLPRTSGNKRLYWEGPSSALYNCLAEAGGDHGNESFRRTVRSAGVLGVHLAKLSEKGYDLHRPTKKRQAMNKWKVYYGVADEAPVVKKKEGEKDETSGESVDPAGADVEDTDTQAVS